MAKTDFQSVDEYIQTFPEERQQDLQAIRKAIRDALPEAEEVISYQLPAYKFHGFTVYFSAASKHYSLSCTPPTEVFEAFKERLEAYKQTKSAIQFPLGKPLPLDLIADIARFRGQENLERAQAKASAKSKPR